MEQEILDELNRVADGFWHDTITLNYEKIDRIEYLSDSVFVKSFNLALQNFLKIRRTDLEKIDHALEKILKINTSKDYYEACDKFLEVVTFAKSNDLFIDNQIIKELEECKEKSSNLENTVKQQKEIINTYKNQIKSAIKYNPSVAKCFGIHESEVEKI